MAQIHHHLSQLCGTNKFEVQLEPINSSSSLSLSLGVYSSSQNCSLSNPSAIFCHAQNSAIGSYHRSDSLKAITFRRLQINCYDFFFFFFFLSHDLFTMSHPHGWLMFAMLTVYHESWRSWLMYYVWFPCCCRVAWVLMTHALVV